MKRWRKIVYWQACVENTCPVYDILNCEQNQVTFLSREGDIDFFFPHMQLAKEIAVRRSVG